MLGGVVSAESLLTGCRTRTKPLIVGSLTSSRIVGFIVALASLGLLLGGCPKPKPPPAPVVEAPAKPALSIEDVAPAETTQGVGVTVHLMGYGFVAGSEVELGGQKTRGVDVIDDGELSFRVSEAAPVGRHDIKVTTPTVDTIAEN